MSGDWPKVEPNDPGIRPAGEPDACFYCSVKVGGEHGKECVMVQRRVRVQFVVTADIAVPAFWDEDMINFRYNESTWCADNLASMMESATTGEGSGQCWCSAVSAKYLGEVDSAPTVIESAECWIP